MVDPDETPAWLWLGIIAATLAVVWAVSVIV